MATPVKRQSGWGRRARVLGFALAALAVLVLGVYQVGKIFNVFSSRYTLVTLAPTAAGLREGAPVTLAGQRVGQVGEIEFIPLTSEERVNNVSIYLSVDEDVAEQIRANSRAYFRTQGLLGDKYVDISPGSPRFPVLQPGDTLPSADIVDLETVLATAEETLEEAQAVIADLRGVTSALATGEGTLGQLLQNDALYERLVATTGQLAVLLRSVNQSEGTIGRLIHDPTLYRRTTEAIARLDTLTGVALYGEGTIARLLRSDTLYERAVGTIGGLDSALVQLNQILDAATTGGGTVDRLLEDPSLYEQLLKAVVDLQTLIIDIRMNPEKYKPDVRVDVFE